MAAVWQRVDCCSSLLIGLPLGTLARLDQVLHSAARLVRRLPKFSSISPTCAMYYIGCLSLSGYNIILLRWSPGVSFAVSPLTFVTSAAQCRFWQSVGCCVLLRGVSIWSLGPI